MNSFMQVDNQAIVMAKMTENEAVLHLVNHLQNDGWEIDSHSLCQKKGIDIVASKDVTKLYVEVKGARASDDSPNKKRELFGSGPIKTHFGKAITQTFEAMDKHGRHNSLYAIAHPDDPLIRKAIGNLIKYLKPLRIIHFWISSSGRVTQV